VKKRTVALAFLVLVIALVLGSLALLRTRWAGDRICALAAARLEAVTGLPLALASCRIDPFGVSVEAEGIRLGPAERPVFTAEAASARLAAVQALGGRLHLARLELVRPRVALTVPAGGGGDGACPPPLLDRFEVRQLDVIEGAVDVALPGGQRVVAEGIEVRARPPARSLRNLASPVRRARLAVSTGRVRVVAGGRELSAARLAVDAEVALDLSVAEIASAEAEVEGVKLSASGRVQELCDPRLDLSVQAEGPVRALLALGDVRREVDGIARVDARITGAPRAPTLGASVRGRGVRIGPWVPGDFEAELRLAGTDLHVDRLEVPAEGGAAVARGTVRLVRGLPIDAEVESAGVDLAEVLDRLGVTGPWVTVRLDGKGHVAGTLSPPQLTGSLAMEVRDFKALTRPYQVARGDPGVLAFPRGRVESAVRIDRQGLYFDDLRVAVGRGAVEGDAAVHFTIERGFSVRARGEVDFGALGRVGDIPWSGRALVEVQAAAAPYGNPRVTGHARAEGFRFLDIDLGALATDFSYGPDFVLRFVGAEGVRASSRYRGEAAVDLQAHPARVLSARYEARGRLRDLFDAVRDFMPRTRYLRDALDGEVEVSGTASGPADALDAEFDARLGTGALLGRAFESGRAIGKVLGGVVTRFDRAELRRGTGAVKLTGTWGSLPPFPWDLEVAFAGVPMPDLELPGGGWTGSASGTARLEGSFDHPRVRFAGNGAGVAVHDVPLGTVQVGGTVTEQRLVVTGGAEGIAFAGEALLGARMPFTARATLALEDASRLVPGGPPAGLRARVVGEASAAGELQDLGQVRGKARLSALSVAYGDARIEAAGPVTLQLAGDRVELAPVVLRGASTELTLAGAAAPALLDLTASGVLDLRLLGGLVPALRQPHGQLAIEAHVGGSVEQPLLVGSGRITDAGFRLRGLTAALSGLGGGLAFSQNRILFDALAGSLNGGRVTLKGEVELARLVPARLRLEGALDEVPVAVPATLPATLTGRIEAEGTPEATLVTGRLHVVRARYTERVDLEGSLLELGRRPLPPPRPYDRAEEWLRFDVQLAVDGDARVDNDLVRGALQGELTLTGTLAAPGLVGSLSMGEGSRVVFRGNEFSLTHAVLDFTDRHKVEIALDVHGESQVRDYQVLMHVVGSLARPDVTLTSQPSLPQPDIITLLSLGFTRRDAAAGASVQGVATAAAAQALFSASGLDDQVRRFLPRGGPVRDLSMRITSAYSEESGQVEPRAEFESWLLRDRLRLRFQAPLGGAKGRKAQAELRLGEHTALQYQWDNDNPDVATTWGGDHGVDLKLRWEWTDDR
jgi:translocation and assembly module TamB